MLLVAGLSAFVDMINIARGKFKDGNGKLIQNNYPIIFVYVLWMIILILVKACLPESGSAVQENVNAVQIKQYDIPLNERSFEDLYKCKYVKDECALEYNKRLEIAVQTIDSIYAEGNIREAVELSQMFYNILRSNGSTIRFEEHVPTKDGVEKRINNLLPEKGCIEDSLQSIT